MAQKARRFPYEMREKVSNELEMLRKQDITEDVKDEPKKLVKTTFSQDLSKPTITCSNLTIETLEQGVKYVQS